MTIKEFRAKTGFTQEQFSTYFRVPLWMIEDWEAGRLKLPSYFVTAMAQYYEEHNKNR